MAQPQHTAILTRPAGRNTTVMRELIRRGWSVLECPALDIREVVSVTGECPRPELFDLVVFVSRAAVTGYHSHLLGEGREVWPLSTRVACMGPVTASAIRRVFGDGLAVLHPSSDLAQDSESLWPILLALEHPVERVLIVRGQDGRDWLSQRLSQRGANVVLHQAYQRQSAQWPTLLNEHLAALSRQRVLPTWLLTSAHGVEALYKNLEALGLLGWFAESSFVLTHERLKPLLFKLLEPHVKSSYAGFKCVLASPEDDVILTGFEQISRPETPSTQV
jgi:uroporphyrinogen-III synthase